MTRRSKPRRGPSAESSGHAAFVERLKQIIDAKKTAFALADETGIPTTTVSSWLRGVEPTRPALVKLADKAGISLEWLCTGRGEMRADRLPRGYALVPRLLNDPGRDVRGVDYLALSTEWLKTLPGAPKPEHLILTEASGDAMNPTIRHRDLVLINGQDRELRDGLHAFVTTAPSPLFRRVIVLASDRFELRCDDPAYALAAPIFRTHGSKPGFILGESEGEDIIVGVLGRVILIGHFV